MPKIVVIGLFLGLVSPSMGVAKIGYFSSKLSLVIGIKYDTIPIGVGMGSKTAVEIDSATGYLHLKIDSLKKLQLPTAREAHLIDSLKKASPLQDIRQAENKVKGMENGAMQKINKLNTDLSKAEKQLGVNLPKEITNGAKVPTLSGVPNLPSNGLSKPGNSTSEINTFTNAPQKEITAHEKEAGVGNVKQELAQVNGYSKDLKQISNGNLDSTQLLKTAESKANQLVKSELKQMPQQNGQLAQMNKMGEAMQDPKAAQQLAADQLRKQAVDHFAGKEKELQAAMQQISKLKMKYSSLSSLQDIKKLSRNQMHGKPFVERFVPGVNFQAQVKHRFTLDINPQAGYRWTKKLTVGAGWNERISIHHYRISFRDRIFGPRLFTEFQVKEGYTLRAEVEWMNAHVPLSYLRPFDQGDRRWVSGVFFGFKKSYSLNLFLRGNIQTMYNFAQHYYIRSPYTDRINVRVGFDFPMKKKLELPRMADLKLNYMKAARPFLHNGWVSRAKGIAVLSHRFDQDTVSITKGIQRRGLVYRKAITTYGSYSFRYNKKARLTEILNAGDTIIATSKHFYDITLPDGRRYDFKKEGRKSWKYLHEGKEVVTGDLIGTEPNTAIAITWIDKSEKNNEVLKLLCQIYGTRLIEKRKSVIKW